MVWTKLFKTNSFEQALKPRKNGIWHINPILKGRNLYNVTRVFRMVDIPFVWSEKEILRENNHKSPYHKFPKGIEKKERALLERVLKLQQGIVSAKEKELKYRQESLNKRPYKGLNGLLKQIMPFLLKPTVNKNENNYREKKTQRMVSDFVKEVPKVNKSTGYGRRSQEKIKNLMEDQILDTTTIKEGQKQIQKEKLEQLKDQKKLENKNKNLNQISQKQDEVEKSNI